MPDFLPNIVTRPRAVRQQTSGPKNVGKRLSIWTRINLFVGGVLGPLCCHLLSLTGARGLSGRWQSGRMSDKLSFILEPTAGFVLYPMLLYCLIAMSLFLIDERRYGKRFWVRLGIFGGVPLAAWYSVIAGASDAFVDLQFKMIGGALLIAVAQILIALIIWLSLAGFSWLGQRPPSLARTVLMAIWVVSYLGLIVAIGESLVLLFILPIICAPVWAVLTYTVVSIRILFWYPEARRFNLLQLLSFATWMMTFMGLCRVSVLLSLNAYLKLPTQNPNDCYVASAAAFGHRAFVGTQRNTATSFPVNEQLRVLKAFEILLWTLFPKFHRELRWAYDRIGPIVARQLRSRFLADLAYCSLKPAEWFARVTLYLVLRDQRGVVARLYR